MKTIKCAWCGVLLPLAGNGKRPRQHKNGKNTCVGSGQLTETHERVRDGHPNTLTPNPKKR